MLLADRRQHFKTLGRRYAAGKGAQRRILNRRAVSQRIGKRNAQLQRIGTRFDQGVDDPQRLLRRGVAQGNEWHKCPFLTGFKLLKQLLITFHQISPLAFKIS